MPPIFHEDIAAVKKLQEQLALLRKEYEDLLNEIKVSMKQTRDET